jgi:4-hydroxybenzoate polyprenyltransferase
MKTTSMLSTRFWKAYWTTMRPYLFFVSGAATLLGLAHAPFERPLTARWWIAFVVGFVAYGLGQALTDCTQLDTDSLSSPYRPLVQGVVRPRQIVAANTLLMAAGGIALFKLNVATLPLVLAMVGGIATYTFFKRRYWGGPPWNSWIVALLPLVAYLAAAPTLRPWQMPAGLAWGMGAVFFCYATFVIVGYFKDISADRATGYNTVVVRFGWKKAALISLAAALCGVVCSAISLWARPAGSWTPARLVGLAEWATGLVILLFAHYQIYSMDEDEDLAYPAIGNTVRGFVLLLAGESVVLEPRLYVLSLVFCGAYELSVARRPEARQI